MFRRGLPLSPLLIQMFLRYLEGMLTRKRCPWAVSTSCRLFPGVLSTWSKRDQELVSLSSQLRYPVSYAASYPHSRGPREVEGWGGRAACAQCHSPSRSAAGQRAPCAPPAPPSPHASSWWPETCWVLSQGGEGCRDYQLLLLSFLDGQFRTQDCSEDGERPFTED